MQWGGVISIESNEYQVLNNDNYTMPMLVEWKEQKNVTQILVYIIFLNFVCFWHSLFSFFAFFEDTEYSECVSWLLAAHTNTSGCAYFAVLCVFQCKLRFSRNLLILYANDHETYYYTSQSFRIEHVWLALEHWTAVWAFHFVYLFISQKITVIIFISYALRFFHLKDMLEVVAKWCKLYASAVAE